MTSTRLVLSKLATLATMSTGWSAGVRHPSTTDIALHLASDEGWGIQLLHRQLRPGWPDAV